MKKEVDDVLQNVYYDTAAVPFLYKNSIYNLTKIFGINDKILFGSDYPLISPKRYFRDIEESVKDDKLKRQITGENAKLLFDF